MFHCLCCRFHQMSKRYFLFLLCVFRNVAGNLDLICVIYCKWWVAKVAVTPTIIESRCFSHTQNHLSSDASLMTEFKTASGSYISTQTVRQELSEMGFHGWATACKYHITMCNGKRWQELCEACCNWILEQLKHVHWSDVWWWWLTNQGLADENATYWKA